MNKEIAFDTAKKGAIWLSSLIQTNGRFIYGYNVKTRAKLKDYNILRHQGSIWAMLEICKEMEAKSTNAEEQLEVRIIKDKAKLALDYMLDRFMFPLGSEGRVVIAEDGYIKLGAAGLGVLALLKYHEIQPNERYLKIAIDLCRYIISRTCESGRLTHHKCLLKNPERDKGFISEFYIGEAALALCVMDETDNKEGFKYYAEKIINWYSFYRNMTSHVRDHWMMQTLEHFGGRYIEYANKIARKTMWDPVSKKSGPTACRSETLLAYHNILEAYIEEYLKDTSRKSDGKHIAELKTDSEMVMGFVDMLLDQQKKSQIVSGKKEDIGAFRHDKDSNNVRNDYCQHNISSFLKFYKLSRL